MSQDEASNTGQGYEILVAVEDDILRGVIEEELREAGKIYVVVEPNRLIERDYPGEHLFLLGCEDLDQTKQIAQELCVKWWDHKEWDTLHSDFNFMYFTKSELTDEDVFSLWGIAGMDATFICNYGLREYEQNRRFLRKMIGIGDVSDADENKQDGAERKNIPVVGKSWVVRLKNLLLKWSLIKRIDLPGEPNA